MYPDPWSSPNRDETEEADAEGEFEDVGAGGR